MRTATMNHADWVPANAETAVILACDETYLPFAACLAWQIASASGPRDFDILILSETAQELPRVLTMLGVKQVVLPVDDIYLAMPARRLPHVAYLPLSATKAFEHRYRRMLCLDCDILFEGGDVSRLLAMDLKGYAVGAVRDLPYFFNPNHHAGEFKRLGRPARPYLNSGVLLIDPAAFLAAKIPERAADLARSHPDLFVFHDQSILNAVLDGEFVELSPTWNWMVNLRLPSVSSSFPVVFRHFIADQKPFLPKGQGLDRRFIDTYHHFFRTFMPDAVMVMPARAPRRPAVDTRALAAGSLDLVRHRKTVNEYLSRFPDEWTVISNLEL